MHEQGGAELGPGHVIELKKRSAFTLFQNPVTVVFPTP